MKRAFLAIGGILVSAVALVLAFGEVHLQGGFRITPRVHWADLRAALLSARWGWLALFTVFNVASLVPRAFQLRALARRRDGSEPRLSAAYHACALGLFAQNILPARLGEAARVVALSRADDVSPAAGAAAVLFGRVLDLIALIVVVCVPSLLLEVGASPRLRAVAIAGSVVGVVLIAGLALLYRKRDALVRRAHRIGPRVGHLVDEFTDGLSALGSRSRLLQAGVSSLAAPIVVALCYACALRAFDLGGLPTGSSLVLVATILLAIAVPSAPSSVGVYHAAVTWLLPRLGAPVAQAAAFAIVTHALGVVTFIAVGLVSMTRLHVGPRILDEPVPG
jgi:uncharacterized protein (TIRG00374 family)